MKTRQLQNNLQHYLQQPILIKLLFITFLFFQFTSALQADDFSGFHFDSPRAEQHFDQGANIYVNVIAEDNDQIDYMELSINDQFIRRETRAPYEWRGNNGDNRLSNLQAGTYTLKVMARDIEGNSHEITRTFYVNNDENLIPFKIKVKTGNPGTSNDNQFEVPMITGDEHSYAIDCNSDGQIEANNQQGSYTCTYPNAGEYTVSIYSQHPRIYFNGEKDRSKLVSVEQWGDGEWLSMENAFSGCWLLSSNATDAPNLNQVKNMSGMFQGSSFNQNINSWDVSNVTDMSRMFYGAQFNGDIGSWDVSNVTNMTEMFKRASNFNQNIGRWNVSDVTNMTEMFSHASNFNQNIGRWNISKVTLLSAMFNGARSFNQDIGDWDVSKVTKTKWMFQNALSFNQDIGRWDVSNVTSMTKMFKNAANFNQDIGNWNVSKVIEMINMFEEARNFNQDIGRWDVSNVWNMSNMFRNARNFNQNIGGWDVSYVGIMSGMFHYANSFNQDIARWNVSNVTDMSGMFQDSWEFNQNINNWNVSNVSDMSSMFENAITFNQNLGSWNVGKVTSMRKMFQNAIPFNQNLGNWNVSKVRDMRDMFTGTSDFKHYSNTLEGWSRLVLKPRVKFDGGRRNKLVLFSHGYNAKKSIIKNFGWTITDGGHILLKTIRVSNFVYQ